MKHSERRADLPHYAELAVDYELEAELGRGATAVVYLGRERELGREVAIKVGHTRAGEALRSGARLRREARMLGRLQHPNIVMLYGVRKIAEDGFALIMQHVRGRTLDAVLAAGEPLSFDRVRRILAEIGRALACAHDHGIVHGAVGPDHIHIEDETGTARLGGFGNARTTDEPAPLRGGVGAPGAPAYMSPEQAAGGTPDARSDIYALGLIGYALLGGAPPLPTARWSAAARGRSPAELPSLARPRPGIPEPLWMALEGALAEDPADRWEDAHEFVTAVEGKLVQRAWPVGAGQEAGALVGREPSRGRWRAPVAVALLLLVAAGALLGFGVRPWSADVPAAATAPPASMPNTAVPVPAESQAGTEPAVVYALFGDWQEGAAGDTLPEQLVLRVEDAAGRPVAGAMVRFTTLTGDGSIQPTALPTDEFGLAGARWIPLSTGLHEVEATVDGVTGRASFRARARAPSPPLLAGGDQVDGAPDAASGPARLTVRPGLALGGMHSCALRGDGVAFCWGGNDSGQLGDGAAGRRGAPVTVAAPEPLAELAAGVAHTCAVGVSGALYCWGGNASGQLGDGSATNRARPLHVATGQRLVRVAAGLAHSCALDANGALFCWGQNPHGQLGDGSRAARTTPVAAAPGRRYRAVSVGWAHTCALGTDGAAYCWGRNDSGQLGDGTTTDRAEPVRVGDGHRYTVLASGSHHTCGLRIDGAVLCWGQNTYGQLGTGSTEAASTPSVVSADARYTALALGGVHSCALAPGGTAYCWGRNTYGQLGDGTTQDRSVPVAVHGSLRFTALHASGAHTCGTTGDGRAHCWGYNVEGQLGTGTRANQSRPATLSSRW